MIITHPGKAHQDDFLAACVCAYKLGQPLFRLDWQESHLTDASVWMIDQGGRFQPELHNFDHHHLKEEICSFTMILDHFYDKKYRDLFPGLKYIEICDSYGPQRAADFVGATQEALSVASSPISSAMIKFFGSISGEVKDPLYSVMQGIGEEICHQIETKDLLLSCLDDHDFFETRGIKIFDCTKCQPPEGFLHCNLPTKIYCKNRRLNPDVILAKDSISDGYRMIVVKSNSLRFLPNEKSYFTHSSGFMTGFSKYEDYVYIISNYIER